jgi:hypothetical protein
LTEYFSSCRAAVIPTAPRPTPAASIIRRYRE